MKNDPPKIMFSPIPAVLIIIDGEPTFRLVEGTRYARVMNTLALVLFDSTSGTFYLDGNRCRMTASSLQGPWAVAVNPAADLDGIRAQLNK